MKKIISILITAAMLLALGATLASCAHKCEFSDDWSSDDDYHWHACEDESCVEVADKAEHEWDDGKITTAATQEKDGEKTFTCTVCDEKKTEKVVFTGYTKEEWDAAFAISIFENFSYTEKATATTDGVSVETELVYKCTKDSAWAKMTVGPESEEESSDDKEEVDRVRENLVDSIKDIAVYDKFEYDAATKTYKAKSPIEIAAIGESSSDVTLKFEDGKLVECKYSISFEMMDMECTASATITLSDYGTVELDV
jgi:hypothetical protein